VQPDVHTKVPPLYVCTMWENIDSAGPCLTKLSKVYGNSCYENDLFSDRSDKLKIITFPNIKWCYVLWITENEGITKMIYISFKKKVK